MPDQFHRYPCPSCGAELNFNPKAGSLTCPFCGRQDLIPQSFSEIQEHAYDDYLRPSAQKFQTLAINALEVACEGCSAIITFTPPQVAGACPFCGNQIVAQPKSADPMVAPEAILPFSITQQQSDEILKKWLSSRWFAPNSLKHLAYREGASGIYLPYWTFDANTLSYYRGERGVHYYISEEFTETDAQGNQVTRTRQVQKTNWYSASGQVVRWFDDVLITATKSINRERLASLEPWDLPSLKPYDPAYIAGYKAQRYEIELADGFEAAKQTMLLTINSDVRQDIGGDEQRIHEINTHYSGITFKHILLPVYLGAYRFNQKPYQVMINARTGLIQGDRPYSFWKIFFFVLTIFAIITLITVLASSGKD